MSSGSGGERAECCESEWKVNPTTQGRGGGDSLMVTAAVVASLLGKYLSYLSPMRVSA